jgi:hypothetical protein
MGALSESNIAALFEAIENSQILEDRRLFLSLGSPNPLMQPEPDLDCLPPFYQLMVLRKEAFPDERDYYASIKAMRQIQKAFTALFRPYFVASMVATKKPLAMHKFAESLEKQLGELYTVDPEDLPLLLQGKSYIPPLSREPEFGEQIATMRKWEADRMPLRTFLLLAHLFRIGGHTAFVDWMEYPHLWLSGDSPIEHIQKGHWAEVGDLAEKLLSGNSGESK